MRNRGQMPRELTRRMERAMLNEADIATAVAMLERDPRGYTPMGSKVILRAGSEHFSKTVSLEVFKEAQARIKDVAAALGKEAPAP